MKISKINFILCQYPLPTPIPLSCGVLTARNFGLVRIETDSDIVGYGETSINFPPWSFHERKATIEEGLASFLLGENPLGIGRLWHKMVSSTKSFTRMWAEGAILQAIGGVDLALWDIAGKEYGKSVSNLIGGRFREEAEVYATGFKLDDPGVRAKECIDKGYRMIKLRVGFDDDRDEHMVQIVRGVVGGEIGLMLDANMAWDYRQARKMMGRLSKYNLFWMEEPLLCDDLEGFSKLKEEFPHIPLAWGENAFNIQECRRFLDAYAVDYFMPDPSRAGGLTPCIRMCETALHRGIPFSPHHYGSDLGFAATLQLVASQPNFRIMLRDISDTPLRDEIITEPFEIHDGHVTIPSGPGHGVTINDKIVDRYRVII